MKNWKTTLSALLMGFSQIGMMFGLPPEVGQAVTTLGLFLMGLFAADSAVVKKVSGNQGGFISPLLLVILAFCLFFLSACANIEYSTRYGENECTVKATSFWKDVSDLSSNMCGGQMEVGNSSTSDLEKATKLLELVK